MRHSQPPAHRIRLGASAAMTSVPEHFVEKLDEVMNNENVPILKRVDQLCEMLQKNGYGYTAMVKPRETLAHPSNRGGSLLNPIDVWEKGLRMVSVGVKPTLLEGNGMAFEMSTDQDTRLAQIQANESVVRAADGCLAKVTMEERFLTVATSHTAAFCKAIEQGLKSYEGVSVDTKSDNGLYKLVNEGWPMFVISEKIERSMPSLPSWLQMAMNSMNLGFKQVNEIEAAALMSDFIKHGKSLSEARAAVEKSDPLCKPQLGAIAYYVGRYGGGEQQGLLQFLSQFSVLATCFVFKSKWQ